MAVAARELVEEFAGRELSGGELAGRELSEGELAGREPSGGDLARELAGGGFAGRELAGPELSGRGLAGRGLAGRELSGGELSRELAGRELAGRELLGREVSGGKPAISAELVERAAPVSLSAEQRLPVLPALASLLPAGGLRRGSVVAVEGSSSLALALAAAASVGGSWCAAVGRPALGLAAAAELGIVLDRFPLVPVPDPSAGAGPGGWAWVVATLLDALDLVIAWSPVLGRSGAVRPADARRLASRARERGSVLVVASASVTSAGGARAWPEAPDVRLAVVHTEWRGLGGSGGAGRLRGRRVEVVAGGRGAASRERRATLWLPAPGGGVTIASDGEPGVGKGAPVEGGDVGRGWGRAG